MVSVNWSVLVSDIGNSFRGVLVSPCEMEKNSGLQQKSFGKVEPPQEKSFGKVADCSEKSLEKVAML